MASRNWNPLKLLPSAAVVRGRVAEKELEIARLRLLLLCCVAVESLPDNEDPEAVRIATQGLALEYAKLLKPT